MFVSASGIIKGRPWGDMVFDWIPACAGMTKGERGNDEGGARDPSRLLVLEEHLMMGGTQE